MVIVGTNPGDVFCIEMIDVETNAGHVFRLYTYMIIYLDIRDVDIGTDYAQNIGSSPALATKS